MNKLVVDLLQQKGHNIYQGITFIKCTVIYGVYYTVLANPR